MFIGKWSYECCFPVNVTSSTLRNVKRFRFAARRRWSHLADALDALQITRIVTRIVERLMSFPYMESESCRSRLGDALSPGKDFKFHTYSPPLRVTSPQHYAAFGILSIFRLRRADRLLSSFGPRPMGCGTL